MIFIFSKDKLKRKLNNSEISSFTVARLLVLKGLFAQIFPKQDTKPHVVSMCYLFNTFGNFWHVYAYYLLL